MSKGAQKSEASWVRASISRIWSGYKSLFCKGVLYEARRRGGPALAYCIQEAAPMESLADRIALCLVESHFFSFLRVCNKLKTNRLTHKRFDKEFVGPRLRGVVRFGRPGSGQLSKEGHDDWQEELMRGLLAFASRLPRGCSPCPRGRVDARSVNRTEASPCWNCAGVMVEILRAANFAALRMTARCGV
jgi:hypothetical protein